MDISTRTVYRDRTSKKRLRSKTIQFDWKSQCFLCAGHSISDKSHYPHIPTREAHILPFRSIILQPCQIRGDEWTDDVELRLHGCLDLIAAGAVYHKICHTLFMINRPQPTTNEVTGSRLGRKPDLIMHQWQGRIQARDYGIYP